MTDALALRIAGHPLDEIADQLGHPDTETTDRAVRDGISRTGYAHLPEQYALHLLRLDTISDALAARDPEEHPERATGLLRRAQHQRLTVLSSLAASLADALQRADSDRQNGDLE